MQLWQMDIVGGIMLASGAKCKVVTGVDDHSRYCVAATVVVLPTGRAVCLALATALNPYGIPDELLTDDGKQFTARFGRGGEVLFDRICRENGITHRLTRPNSPTTTGKVERSHQTLRRELLDEHGPFTSIEHAQHCTVTLFRKPLHGPEKRSTRRSGLPRLCPESALILLRPCFIPGQRVEG
jgi:transposase InsO family protein